MSKKILKYILIFIGIIFNIFNFILIASLFFIIFLLFLSIPTQKDKLAYTYKDKNKRLAYFQEKKEDFEYFSQFLLDNDEIESINYQKNFKCDSIENKITINVSDDIIMCKKRNINDNKSYDFNTIKEKYKNLNLEKITKIKDINHNIYSIDFILFRTNRVEVSYDYCVSPECKSKDYIYYDSEGNSYRNKIDDKWYTMYDGNPGL